MKALQIKPNIYWVGAVDWTCRNFHGYDATRGVTYNAYLIIDEKITLIDNVHHSLTEQMIEYISSIIDPAKIDVIISNHGEPDHSGSLKLVLSYAPNAVVYATPNGEKILKAQYGDLKIQTVKNNEPLSLGKRTLRFIHTPMVHWPDNMVTYDETDKILFSNDAFGQHIASSERYDKDYPKETFFYEMKKYYANIILPYSMQTKKALELVKTLDLEMICPSHGLMITSYKEDVFKLYEQMVNHHKEEKAVIIFDTMWGSTEKMAVMIAEAFINNNMPVSLFNISNTHFSTLITEVMEAKYLVIGSPTLNNGMMPAIASFLHYLKGLKPANLEFISFGSYGWGGQSPDLISEELRNMGYKELISPLKQYFVPTKANLEQIHANITQALKNK